MDKFNPVHSKISRLENYVKKINDINLERRDKKKRILLPSGPSKS